MAHNDSINSPDRMGGFSNRGLLHSKQSENNRMAFSNSMVNNSLYPINTFLQMGEVKIALWWFFDIMWGSVTLVTFLGYTILDFEHIMMALLSGTYICLRIYMYILNIKEKKIRLKERQLELDEKRYDFKEKQNNNNENY